jgi:hypothetical protein
MSHAFGDQLSQLRARKHGLSQTRLAHLAGYDPAVLVRMCQGKKDLTGPSGRDRIVRIIDALHREGVLKMQAEANALLQAASMPPLYAGQPAEAVLLAKLDGKREEHSSPASLLTHKSRLPHSLTPLIGREADVAQVKQWLLRPEVRVLTLIGPPGVGKTRLALQVASEVTDGGEIFFVALAPIGEAAFVLPAIAQALGVIQSPAQPLMVSVKNAIHDRRMLLVIDNFEHVPDAAPQVAELLAASPLPKVLTTSRVALRISGEQEYTVQPLALQPATDLLIQRAGREAESVA